MLAISGGLLFYQLGHYPLWCDEADTALYARGVARTGDTYAMLGQNIYAWRQGTSLIELRGRYAPPAPFYFAAPFVGRSGAGTFWPRFPFTVCGLLSIALIAYWLWRDGASRSMWVVMSLGIVTNVSLMLYFRQCRYYGLATLLSLAAAYCYLHWTGGRRMLVLFSVLAILLMLTQYLPYAGLMVCIVIDYLVFGSQPRRLTARELAGLLVPQLVFAVVIVSIWNPLNKELIPPTPGRIWLADKLTLLWWNFRDMNLCEFGVPLLMLVAPPLYLLEKNPWLLHAWLAILTYTLIVTILSPQPVGGTLIADVRYLEAMIPLCIFLTSLVIVTLARHKAIIAVPLAVLAFGTNTLNQPWNPHEWRSSLCLWIEELAAARSTAMQQAIDWVDRNVAPGQSIWVWPDFMTYPLMYHAPQALYAWQLQPPAAGEFKNLPSIHFIGLDAPDYILAFGRRSQIGEALEFLKKRHQADYKLVDTLDVFWDDLTRPELLWRSFKPKKDYNPEVEAVYVLRRSDLKPSAPN